ncbi:MAG TPA: energy transducer TonB [Rhizomicrobium sp.]|jgi:protein TonB
MSSIAYPNTVAPAAERRTLIVTAVAGIHIAAIYAILVGLNIVPSPIKQHTTLVDVFPTIPKTPAQPVPPTNPTTFSRPTRDDPVPPTWAEAPDDPGHTITGDPGPQTGGGGGSPPVVMEGPVAVAGTHTIPPYPLLDQRLNHEGTVLVSISLDARGAVTNVTVARSSGYEGLDAAAMQWVQAHWLYKPARQGDAGVPSNVKASVVFRIQTMRN